MGSRKELYINFKRITTWLMIIALGINCFSTYIYTPVVYANNIFEENTVEESTVEEHITADEHTEKIEDTDGKSNSLDKSDNVTEDNILQEKTEDLLQSTEKNMPKDIEISDENVSAVSNDGMEDFFGDNGVIHGNYENSAPIKLIEDVTIQGTFTVNYPVMLNGHTLYVNGDVIINDYLYVNGDLNIGCNLKINKGYLIFIGGRLTCNGSFLDVGEDFKAISMQSDSDYLYVGGDFILAEKSALQTSISAGIIRLDGDFTQRAYVNYDKYTYGEGNFIMSGSSSLILSGTEPQNIFIGKESSGFNVIEVDAEGLYEDENGKLDFGNRRIGFSGLFNCNNYIDNGCPTTYGYAVYDELAIDDRTYNWEYFYGSIYYVGDPLKLEKKYVGIIGDLILDGDMSISYTTMYIFGSLRIQSVDNNGNYGSTNASLSADERSYMYIYGDFVTESNADHSELLTEGWWYVYGSIRQIGKYAKNLVFRESTHLILNKYIDDKDKEIHITMDNPIGNPIGKYFTNYAGTIVIDSGAVFDYPRGTGNYKGEVWIASDQDFVDLNGPGRIVAPVTIGTVFSSYDVIVDADLEILRTFNIFGDIIVNNGTFKLGTNNTHVMANNVIFPDGCTAMLDMQEAGSFLECDNFTYGSCLPSGKLTDGRIICREKFIVNNTGAEDNFVTSDNHRVDMSGSKGYIDIKNPKSCIENVYCSDVVIASDTTTIHNITPNSKPIVKGGIEGYILEHDEIIEGDMILARGCLDLNGHSLTVLGDVYAVSGDIKLNGGAFNVKGNLNFAYRMVEEDKVTVMPSSAYLHMDNDKDIVNIEGDIYANVNRYSNSWLNYAKAGSIRLAGDMLVEANAGGSNSSEQINVCNGTSLYLIGNRKHTLKASSFTVNMTLDDLIIEDNNSVETDYNIQVNGYIDLTNGKNRINKLTLTSQQNELSGYFNGNLELHDGVLADDLHVTGELDIMGELDLAGNKLYAKGINIHGGTFLNGGEMVADELLKLYGKLIMTDSNDIVRTKDMYVYLSEDITDYMTEGTIYINGDFRDTTYESRKFTPSGNSLVVFEASQSSTHYITLENEKSRFKKAEFVTPVKGYVINRSAYEIADEIIASYKDDIPPTAPQKVTGKEDYLVVMLSWEESADDNLLDHYEIIRDGKTVGTTKDTNYSDSVLKPGTDYEYIIKAVDAVGNYSEESIEYVGITKEDKVKPWRIHTPTPKVEKDSFTIDLTNVFIDNVGVDYYVINKDGAEVARLPEYLIYEYMTDDGAKQKIEINTEHPIYEDGGLKYGSKNKYSVYAVDMTGRRSEETYTFIVYPDYAPKAPDDVKVISENGYNTITISGNDIYDCEAYQILRNGDVIAEIKCNEGYDSTYIDAETEVGQEVSYNVRGIGHHGTLGELSELQTIITSSDDDMPVIKRLDASINGNVLNENADFDLRVVDAGGVKRVLVSLEKDGQATGLASYETTDIVTYADLRFNINVDELYGEYTLRIEAEDYRGNVMVESKEYKINIAGIAPVNLIRTYPEATNIKLSWEELENVYRYVIEQVNDNGLATKLAITDNTDLTIRGLTPETEYVFRIIAYDKEGVRGLPSRNISVTTTADTTSPEITYVYPNDKIIGYNDKLALQYSDNVGVTSVFAYYRKSGEDTWSVIVENFKDNLDKGILWNKEGLESGTYEVLYRVSDAAGNLSEDIIGSYILKLDGPAIHGFELTPGDWKIKVSWDNFEDNNYIRYQLERIEAERYDSAIGQGINIHGIKGAIIKIGFDEVYYEEVIAPDKEYVYILRAYDIYGNESDEIVRGRAIDKDPIPPIIDGVFDMFTSTDTPFVLSAEGCTDNDEIISYMWEMGNGDVVTGMECEYVYQNPGSYNVTLTVTDRGGNSTSQTTSVLVGKDVGQVQVTVKSGGKRIEGASVAACINGEIYSDDSKGFTDSKGMVTLTLPEGDFQITACKENYEFYYDIVTVKKGERTKVEISLNENSPITMDTKVKEMTQKEIKDAGLDISTVGKNVYKMDIDLTYKSEKIHTVMLSLDKDIELVKDGVSGGWSGGSPYLSNGAGSYSGSSGGGSGYTSETIRISNISPDPENPVFIITKTVPVSISWMKNVYQVDVTLTNNGAEIFRLVKATAALELSKELHVVTSSKKKSNEWEINELKGGESAEHTWYVTGDKSGSYPFGLTLDGTIMPNDYEFHETLLSRNNIEITTGEGLHLYIYPESEAYIGENYYIQYRLVNESDRDFYYVTTDFGAFRSADRIQKARTIVTQGEDSESVEHVTDTGVQYFVPEEAVGKARVILQNADSMTLEKLKPGDNVYGTYVFQFNAMGNRRKQYYNLVTAYSDEMNANGMGLQVTLIPVIGHLSETVAELKLPAKKKKNDQTGTGNTGNNPYKRPTPVDESYLNSPQTESDTEEVKDPVNLMTGAFTVTHSPVAVSGGMDFRFNMSYDSRYTKGIGELGHGWHHNYEMDIEHNGSLITLHTTSDDIMYFAESDETANVVSGTVDGDQIILSAEDNVDRTYYQTGDSTNKYVIRKMGNSYILTMGTDTYTFDTEGVLTGYRDGEGKELIISRNEEALTITDAATGKRITAGYNEDGRITSVTDPAGNETKLDYENDCLTTLTAKDGNVLSYTYDDKGHILTGSEGERVYVENTYDSDGRVTSQISNGDTKNKTAFVYETDEDGNVTAVMTNADGTTEAGMSDKYGHGLQYKNAIGGVRKYLYNEQGDMTEFSDMDGSGKSYSYDDRGNITEIRENTGKVLSYAYDDNNHITSIKGNDGTDISYTYNDKGQRTKVESGNGITAEYTYNKHGQVLTERSALGTISYSYKDGMLDRLTDHRGNTHSFKYDANGNVTSYTDGAGITTEYDVDVRGNVTKETVKLEDGRTAVTSYTYDAYGNMLSKTDTGGNKTEYRYDNEDRLTKEIRPDGTAYEYNYDDNGSLTEIVCPDGETKVSAAYDAAGNTLSVTNLLGGIQNASYSAGSQLLSLTQANGGKISYTYYDNGLLKTQTDAAGNTSTLTYDEAGRLRTVTDGAGAVTTLSYDKDGNLASVENALGNKTELLYNEYRKVTKAVDNNANATFYKYDAALNCTKVIDAEGGVTELAYDGRNRITSVTKKGTTRAEDVTLTMTYDNLNNVTSITDGEGNTHRMEYNELSQLVKVYDAKGVLTGKYDYDSLGNCISVTDAFGTVTERSYDAFGNLIKELNKDTGNAVNYAYIGGRYLSAATDALGNSASYTYDSMGNLETVTNPNGGVTTYRYDLNGNVTDEIIGEEYHVRYTYNAQNLAETKVNSRSQKAEYKYDLLGRITEQKDEAGTISYTYDGNDNVLTVTETVGDNTTTITRTYDKLNRVTSYDDGRGNKIGYEYDILGNLVTLTYPNGRDVNYTYDKNGNILTMTDWAGRKTSYSYDGNGRLVKTIRPNGTVETREYDKAGRLTEILDKKGGTEVNHQEYTYDSSGNIIAVKQLQSGELDFTGVNSAEMTYDKNNRLLTYNGENIKYDKDGNMTYGPLAGEMAAFVYDCRNRLIQAGDARYTYDAENNRIGVERKEKKTTYVINTQPELSQVLQSTETKIEENDNKENTITTHYFYGNGLNAQDNGKDYFVYHFNNVGSTMAVTDAKGSVVETYNYTPYGELIDGEYREDIPFLYNGQYGVVTDNNGLYYMRARYYNADIKRFINQDVLLGVLERISSLNRYAYVEGNPVSYLDPFGLERHYNQETYMQHKVIGNVTYIIACINVSVPNPITLVSGLMIGCYDIGLYVFDLTQYKMFSDEQKEAIQGLFKDIIGLIPEAGDWCTIIFFLKDKHDEGEW